MNFIMDTRRPTTDPAAQPTTRSVLVVHAAVRYSRGVGLGVGLVSRAACARTGKTKKDVSNMQKEGFKIPRKKFQCSKQNSDPDKRAALLGISSALAFAKKTILFRWTAAPTNVVIFLGRPCDESVVALIKHHIEHEPKSLEDLKHPNYWPVVKIIRRIHKIRSFGFKVKIAISDCNNKALTLASKKAEQKFKRVRLERERFYAARCERRAGALTDTTNATWRAHRLRSKARAAVSTWIGRYQRRLRDTEATMIRLKRADTLSTLKSSTT